MNHFKSKFKILSVFMIFLSWSLTAQSPDEDAIKKVIEDETEHFYNLNFDLWSNSFAKKSYFIWAVTNGYGPGEVITFKSWDTFGSFAKSFFDSQLQEGTRTTERPEVSNYDWNIQIRGDIAFVHFGQATKIPSQSVNSTQTRVLERENGVWRIVMQTTLMDFKNAVPPMRSSY